MPVYQLIDQLVFPPPQQAHESGLLAVGGDLSPRRLLLAYSMGIFPWSNEDEPLLWWSPDPRFVLEPDELSVSRSLRKLLRRESFSVTYNRAFRDVISACAEVRRSSGEGTWISPEMVEAFCLLHSMGFAHSVESWQDGELAGGLYGVNLGRCFFGESMFHRRPNASKVAFATLVGDLATRGCELIDCQVETGHLASLGARPMPREAFLQRLVEGGVTPTSNPPPPALLRRL